MLNGRISSWFNINYSFWHIPLNKVENKEPNDNKKLRSKSSLNFFLTPLQSYNVTSWLFFIHLAYSKYPSIKTLFYVFCETRNPKLFLDWNKLIKILKLGLWLTTKLWLAPNLLLCVKLTFQFLLYLMRRILQLLNFYFCDK